MVLGSLTFLLFVIVPGTLLLLSHESIVLADAVSLPPRRGVVELLSLGWIFTTLFTSLVRAADNAEHDERIENPHHPPGYHNTAIKALFHSRDPGRTFNVCWKPPDDSNFEGEPICADHVSKSQSSFMFTTVGHHFEVSVVGAATDGDATKKGGGLWPFSRNGKGKGKGKGQDKGTEGKDGGTKTAVFEIVGGVHNYWVDDVYRSAGRPPRMPPATPAVYVRTPDNCETGGWESVGGLWRDAIRRAAFRRGHALCMCGGYNTSTSFTAAVANPEVPVVLTADHADGVCRCDSPSDSYYDMWFPCSVDRSDGEQLLELETCAPNRRVSDQETRVQHYPHTRLAVVHTTIMVDRLSMKGKMWESLKAVYGFDRAAAVMPASFYTIYPDQRQLLLELCRRVTNAESAKGSSSSSSSSSSSEHYFIVKNEALHRQQGISITSAAHIVADAGVLRDDFTFATQFLPRPYLVRGYKLNMRRYMVAVCTGGRLRGYVHDDGKNIYTKDPYEEPWEVHGVGAGRGGAAQLQLLKSRLDNLITTGYVPASHYDDKPLSGLEFFAEVTAAGGNYTLFQRSMWARLALALHASRSHGDFDLCTVDEALLDAPAVPACLHDAVRFQHFGCDFHVDSALTGYESRLFECNKGPDMHPHNYRDGTMKRDVAADIVSFVGFVGEFDDSDAAARRFRMNKIFDSETFDVDETYAFLDSLKKAPHGAGGGGGGGGGGGVEEEL